MRFQGICPELGVCSDFNSAEDASAVVIFGRERTVHPHLPEVNRRKVPVLVVPCGSGNDFAKAVRIGNVRIALDAWKHFCLSGNNVLELDLGMIATAVKKFCSAVWQEQDWTPKAMHWLIACRAGCAAMAGIIWRPYWCLAAGRAEEIRVSSLKPKHRRNMVCGNC